MELGTRWRDVVIDAVELSVVHRHGHKSSVGVREPVCMLIVITIPISSSRTFMHFSAVRWCLIVRQCTV